MVGQDQTVADIVLVFPGVFGVSVFYRIVKKQDMVYELDSNTVLFEIDRTAIVDISIGDVLKVCCLSDATYTWTEQDTQFMESNPDARLFIRFEQNGKNKFVGRGVTIIPHEVY